MRFGPSGLRASRVLAKGLHRPKMRADLRISEQNIAGEISYVVKIKETASYRRYGEYEFELLQACDGTRTPAELASWMSERHPDQPVDEATVLDFLDSIEPAMWERTIGEKNLAILERLRDERKSRLDQSSVLYLTFSAWDPDKVLTRLEPWLRWMYTRTFVFVSVALFVVMLWLLSGDWRRIATDTKDLWNFSDKSAYDLWSFWVLMLILGGIHEFGHGLTCKHYGGEVHQMGFMLIYLTPAFFTDTTDILVMDRVAPRQWTIFAGIWVELVLTGICAIIWHFSLPGSVVNDLAYKMMLLSGIQGTLLNLNPLIKADGYYALCQYLQIDSLREDSFEFLGAWCRKYVLRQNMDLPAASRRQRRIFLVFSILALVYSTTLITLVTLWARNVCVRKFGAWGYVVFAGIVYVFVGKKLRKLGPVLRNWWAKGKETYMTWRLTRMQTIGMVAFAVLMVVPPLPSRIATPSILEPGSQADVRATVSGIISKVLVRQGDEVQPGQILAVLENASLAADAKVYARQLELAEERLRLAEANGDGQGAAAANREMVRLGQDLQMAKQKCDELEIRAPLAGLVTTPELLETVGEHLGDGQVFCHLSSRKQMRARILVRDWKLDEVQPGARISLKVAAYPFRTYSALVERILPAAAVDRPITDAKTLEQNGQEQSNYVALIAEVPNPDGSLREGMTGTAKVYRRSSPIAWQAGRGFWHWFKSQVW